MLLLQSVVAVFLGAAGAAAYFLSVPAPSSVEPQQISAGPSARCAGCGWIESKSRLAPASAEPNALPSYRYTVRMRDGSTRVFDEQLPASWRIGERLIQIDGY
jgi:hypothetical protein